MKLKENIYLATNPRDGLIKTIIVKAENYKHKKRLLTKSSLYYISSLEIYFSIKITRLFA